MTNVADLEEARRRKADPFGWIETPEIFAPLPPTPWAIKDLQLCPGRLSMFAAYGASGKTLALQSLALAYAAGRSVWGQFVTGRGGKVAYVDHEQGRHATFKRFQRLAKGHEIDPREVEGKLKASIFPSVYLPNSESYEQYCRALDGTGLAIIDALRGATPGIDENDSIIRTHLDVLTKVSEKTAATILLIHHAGKPKDGHDDARTVARGSSAIFDACGSVYVMSGAKGQPKLVSQQKQPAEAEGGAVEDFYLEVEDVPVDTNPTGAVRVVYRSQKQVKPPVKPGARFDRLKDEILDIVRNGPPMTSRNSIIARAKGSKQDKLEAIEELIRDGKLFQLGGNGGVFKILR